MHTPPSPASAAPSTAAAPLPVVRIKPGMDRRVRTGHPWLFSNELVPEPEHKSLPLGTPVRVVSEGGRPVGIGGFNRHALIAVRLFPDTAACGMPDAVWLAGRLRVALALRDRLFDRPYYRLIHAEADGLPGLIVDRYGDVLVVQANAATIDHLTGPLIDALQAVLAPRAIVLRNDSPARAQEGLSQEVTLASGSLPDELVGEEDGVRFVFDPVDGQKTGWFFDQRDNRRFVARLASDRTVLDVYSHTGGFALHAAVAGAAQVTTIDRSAPALLKAERAAELNGVSGRMIFRRAEAFAELERLGSQGQRFDVIVVDPPAFVKSKKDLKAGARGYRKLARLAAQLVTPGGVLLAASCSHHVGMDLFAEQTTRGLIDARRHGRLLRSAGAAADHPVHPLLPESAYLKALCYSLE